MGERTPLLKEDKFARAPRGLRWIGCVHQNNQDTHTALFGEFQHQCLIIEETAKRLSSKKGVSPCMGVKLSKQHVFGVTVDAWHTCLLYTEQLSQL